MDIYTLDSHKYREALWAAQDSGRPVVQAPATTDAMNARAIDQLLVDLALQKRAVARTYARKRWALRQLVEMGVFTPEEARRGPATVLANLKTTWRAARYLMREAMA